MQGAADQQLLSVHQGPDAAPRNFLHLADTVQGRFLPVSLPHRAGNGMRGQSLAVSRQVQEQIRRVLRRQPDRVLRRPHLRHPELAPGQGPRLVEHDRRHLRKALQET